MNGRVEFLFKNVGYGLCARKSPKGFAAAHRWNCSSVQSTLHLSTLSIPLWRAEDCPIRDRFLIREAIFGQGDSRGECHTRSERRSEMHSLVADAWKQGVVATLGTGDFGGKGVLGPL